MLRIVDCLSVNLALIVVYALPAALALRPWRSRGAAAVCLWGYGVILGVAVQATLGMLWNLLIGAAPRIELLVYAGGWMIVGILSRGGDRLRPDEIEDSVPGETWWLAAILLLAAVVRCLHPLWVAYLGQSDAYVHLLFFKDILANGHIRHAAYPAGYHWVMVVPSLLFRLDPYLLARYGGAFFGVLLCLGVYVLLRAKMNGLTASVSAVLLACFPAFTILIKTGVGAFANQLGLACMPFLLLSYVLLSSTSSDRTTRGHRVWFAIGLAGVAASVPLMLLRVGLLIACDVTLRLIFSAPRKAILRRTFGVGLLALPAGLVLACFLLGAGSFWQQVTVESLTGQRVSAESTHEETSVQSRSATDVPAAASPSVLEAAARDWVVVKRHGLHSRPINVATWSLLGLFAGLFVYGLRWEHALWRVLGLLGVLTAVQTLTGVLEFSAYQRAGWHLMMVTVCACGWWAGVVYRMLPWALLRRGLLCVGVIASVVLGLMWPPAHAASMSSAEGWMVRVTRELGFLEGDERHAQMAWAFERRPAARVRNALDGRHRIALVVRSTQGTARTGYWEVADAVVPYGSPLPICNVRGSDDLPRFVTPDRQTVFFIDHARRLDAGELGAVGALDIEQARRYAKWQLSLYRPNRWIREFLDAVDPGEWQRETLSLSADADVVILRP